MMAIHADIFPVQISQEFLTGEDVVMADTGDCIFWTERLRLPYGAGYVLPAGVAGERGTMLTSYPFEAAEHLEAEHIVISCSSDSLPAAC